VKLFGELKYSPLARLPYSDMSDVARPGGELVQHVHPLDQSARAGRVEMRVHPIFTRPPEQGVRD
jgi:hypothetical protein